MSRTFGVCCVLLTVLLVAGCAPAAPTPIWMGHLTPLSGSAQPQGESAVASMQLTLEMVREKEETVAGRSVGVRHADSTTMARAEAVRLLAVNNVAGLILGPDLTDPEEVAASARTHGSAVVILDEVSVAPQGPAVKLLGPDPTRRGRALAQFARTKLKKKRLAVLVDGRNSLSATLARAFTATWRPEGQWREWPVAEAAGLPALRSDLDKYAPDMVLAAVPLGILGNLTPILPAVPILYGGPDVDEEALLPLTAGTQANLYTATVYARTAGLANRDKEWRRRYEKSQQKPPSRSAVLARDGLRLLLAGLTQARSGLRERLRQELPEIKEFDSVTGKVKWVDGMAVRPLFLLRLTAGKPYLVQTMTGEEP